MNEQIKKTLEPLSNFWANTSKNVKRIIIGGLVTIVVAALIFSMILNSKEYVVIFDELSASESAEILAALNEMEVDVKVDTTGAISVLKEEESGIRMKLATEGYPKSGLSYYLIEENSGMLTTDYERKQYVNMQLQERIAASIKTLDGVKDAVVTITAPEEDVFYLSEKEPPTASVIIHMKGGSALSKGQVLGIQNLVAKSVSGLAKENIALSDSQGNDLVGDSGGNGGDYSKLGVTREIENDLRKKIYAVLQGPYDASQFKISVTANVNTDALVKEELLYSPSQDGKNSGVISEETKTSDSSSSSQSDGGVAGTTSNSEVPTYQSGGGTGGNLSTGTTQTTKYKVSQVKAQSQKSGAKIETISIGIAIDKSVFDPGEKESITQLVAYAAGVSPESITIQNFEFYAADKTNATEVESGGINKMLLYGGIGGGVLLLLVGALLLMKMKKRKNVLEAGEAVAAAEAIQNGEALDALFGSAKGEQNHVAPIEPVQDSRRNEVKDFAKKNPEIAAQMIKSWLRSEND